MFPRLGRDPDQGAEWQQDVAEPLTSHWFVLVVVESPEPPWMLTGRLP